jgi:hypothetical protein
MRDIRDHRLRLAATLRRRSKQHSDAGNPEISRKLADVATALDAKANQFEPGSNSN